MPRAQPKRLTFPPATGSALAQIADSVSALLIALEAHEINAPAAKAYRAAIRSRGVEAVAAGGAAALPYLADLLTEAAPDRAKVQRSVLGLSWDGLPGWLS